MNRYYQKDITEHNSIFKDILINKNMETATEDEIKIRTRSPEIFSEAINSLPLLPKYAKIEFLADGICLPFDNKIEREKRYLSECSQKRVIPFSRIELEYSVNKETFVPKASFHAPILRVPRGNSYISNMENAVKSLIKGKRIHEICINTEEGLGIEEIFEEFRKSLLNTFLEQNYQINEGCLEFGLRSEHRNTSLVFRTNASGVRGLNLMLKDDLPSEKIEKLKSWFNELKDRYQLKQLFLV